MYETEESGAELKQMSQAVAQRMDSNIQIIIHFVTDRKNSWRLT